MNGNLFALAPREFVDPELVWPSVETRLVGDAVIQIFRAESLGWPVQAEMSIRQGALEVRPGTQANCLFNCRGCDASLDRGFDNLTVEQILAQVVSLLEHSSVTAAPVETLTVASFGLGEPFANSAIIGAFGIIRRLLPAAELIISTHGPKNREPFFQQLLEQAIQWRNCVLQLSLDFTTDEERAEYVQAQNLHPISGLAQWAKAWRAAGGKVLINCCVGEDFRSWTAQDADRLHALFPDCVIKLSPQNPMHGKHRWSAEHYRHALEHCRTVLNAAGVADALIEVYDPAKLLLIDVEKQGLGCGTVLYTLK